MSSKYNCGGSIKDLRNTCKEELEPKYIYIHYSKVGKQGRLSTHYQRRFKST